MVFAFDPCHASIGIIFGCCFCCCAVSACYDRQRYIELTKAARDLHDYVIDNGGRYNPVTYRYQDRNGVIIVQMISVGTDMAITGVNLLFHLPDILFG